eukprot:CAMPEP_0119133360 /NCGR_PEP_ID=MMETSP1310-20130426/13334_1 /TAXON_ID=464262 /ORGANISM="Genus nov. species nov., Strain RCC2339" /LENGTH=258 /DNA_ID=CAMNT_0007124047 /DNA_START=99 /DNA_END=875 /DNA_ORIENTATION=-
MEDIMTAVDDLNDEFDLKPDVQRSFWGVYDGHGGKQSSDFIGTFLHQELVNHPDFLTCKDYEALLTEVFKSTDAKLLEDSKIKNYHDGCTAGVCLLIDNIMYFANIGDTEIMLVSKEGKAYKHKILSVIHRPDVEEEKKRVLDNGGKLLKGRICGNVIISRSFGDFDYKYPQNKGKGDYVSAVPHTTSVKLTDDIKFLILACDGLWDNLSYTKICDIASNAFKSGASAIGVTEILVKAALDANTTDNVTVTVVKLNEM